MSMTLPPTTTSSTNKHSSNGNNSNHTSNNMATSSNINTNTNTNNNHITNTSNCNSSNSSSSSSSSNNNTCSSTSTTKTTATTSIKNLYQFLCIVCTCIICYYNSTQCGLVFDDISAIRDNKDLRSHTPFTNIFLNDFWGTPMRKEQSHKSYRPLTVLTFRFNYLLHELQPFGYHFVNIVLHIVVCLMWRRVCRLLLLHCAGAGKLHASLNNCAFLATLLFAVHPIHTEAVTGVVGRAELLSSICYLAAFLSYAAAVMPHLTLKSSAMATTTLSSLSFGSSSFSTASLLRQRHQQQSLHVAGTRWFALACNFGICILASMLCKEQGITIAGICGAYEIFVVQQIRPLELWQYVQQFFDEKKLNGSPLHKSTTITAATSKNNNSSNAANKSLQCGSNTTLTNNNIITATSTAAVHHQHTLCSSTLLKRLCFLFCIIVALLVGRVYVMGSQLPVFTRFDNPASAADTPTRQLTFSYLIYLNSWLLLFPCNLCCDWTMGTIPLIEGFNDARNIATMLTFVVLFALVARACVARSQQQSRILLMCLAWMMLPFLPASNLFFPVGFVVAERILYMPSMGFCLLIAYGYTQLQQRLSNGKILKRVTNVGLAVLLLTHALKTHQRNYDWRNEYDLFMSGVHVNARNAKLFNNVGHALENEARYVEALAYFKQAVQIQADDIGAHINVGRTYNNLKMYQEAEQAYLKAKALFPKIKPGESYQARIAPNHLNVFINLANLISKNQTRLEEADYLYRQAISMRADYVQAYINRGDILMKLNRTAQAQEVYEKALLYDSENADIYYNLGVVFLEQGKSAQAHVYFNKAIELYPTHEQALLNSAILLQEIGGADARRLSRERLYKVLNKDEHNEKVYFNLGMLAMDESNFEEAEQFFKRAIHLKENFRSALFNLALLLADANRPLDAVPYLNQLIRHHADHIKGLILLGDIYINHMKDLDAAEACYRSILKYEPHNIQGLHNLCVVFVERKRLAKALACLRYAHHLAPAEDYILRHLQIVQTRLQKIAKLPDTAAEKQAAFLDYAADEFKITSQLTQQLKQQKQQLQQQQQQQQQKQKHQQETEHTHS